LSDGKPYYVALVYPNSAGGALPSPGFNPFGINPNALSDSYAGKGPTGTALLNAFLTDISEKTDGLENLTVDETGAHFADTTDNPVYVGVEPAVAPGTPVFGKAIVLSGQSYTSGTLEGSKGGIAAVQGGKGGHGGDAYTIGGDAEVSTKEAGDAYLVGGYYSNPDGSPLAPGVGSRGGNVEIQARFADAETSGEVRIKIETSNRILVDATKVYIGADNAASVELGATLGHTIKIAGNTLVSISGASIELGKPLTFGGPVSTGLIRIPNPHDDYADVAIAISNYAGNADIPVVKVDQNDKVSFVGLLTGGGNLEFDNAGNATLNATLAQVVATSVILQAAGGDQSLNLNDDGTANLNANTELTLGGGGIQQKINNTGIVTQGLVYGADHVLADGNTTKSVSTGRNWVLPDGTLTGNGSVSFDSSGATGNDLIGACVTRIDVTAHTYTVKDSGTGATLYTFPSMTGGKVWIQWDDVNGIWRKADLELVA